MVPKMIFDNNSESSQKSNFWFYTLAAGLSLVAIAYLLKLYAAYKLKPINAGLDSFKKIINHKRFCHNYRNNSEALEKHSDFFPLPADNTAPATAIFLSTFLLNENYLGFLPYITTDPTLIKILGGLNSKKRLESLENKLRNG